jgi:threonine/homoserine/homoserine lactone efflux protein
MRRDVRKLWPRIAGILVVMVLLLGFVTGLALVAPIGPVALTLFGLGAEQGRRAALAGARGVVLGDSISMPIALGGAGFLGGLDAGIVRWLEVVMGVVLIAVAALTVLHAERARAAIATVRRPTRTLAAMTLCNPLTLVAWVGLALALPQSLRSPAALGAFGGGILLASALWHTGLAAASGVLGPRMGDRTRTLITQGSGVFLLGIGGLLVA